jgi:hypothetical protein
VERIYRSLLQLYPFDFRLWFGAEMIRAFTAGQHRQGFLARLRFLLPELASLVSGAATEWFAKWTADPVVRARTMPDWRMMRPAGISKQDWFGATRRPCSLDT